jgi:hypothetical protein
MPTGSPKAAAAAAPPPQPEREQVAGGGAAGAGEVFLAGQGAPRERGKGQRRPSEESINTSSPREGWTRFCYSMFSSACALGPTTVSPCKCNGASASMCPCTVTQSTPHHSGDYSVSAHSPAASTRNPLPGQDGHTPIHTHLHITMPSPHLLSPRRPLAGFQQPTRFLPTQFETDFLPPVRGSRAYSPGESRNALQNRASASISVTQSFLIFIWNHHFIRKRGKDTYGRV